ncbi:MAG: T9SS type A sorting domain-containing protein [Lentimicrobium sp.]|nr:T9SS type A sorting domain-containing protein [Lentimicrobium sp.]
MESNETTIDLSSYPKGMYFVTIKNRNESFGKKIIKH